MKDIIFREASLDEVKELLPEISPAIHPATLSLNQVLVQVAYLPFYETFKLYEVTDLRLPAGSAYEMLCGPDGAFLLDRTGGPVFRVNQMAPVKLDPETIPSYIRFFFKYIDNPMGSFVIAETEEDIPFLPEASEEEIATAAELLEPITCETSDEKGVYTSTATLIFQDSLFHCDIKVAAAAIEILDPGSGKTLPLRIGEVMLTNQTLLLPELPVEYDSAPEPEEANENPAFQPYDTLPQIAGIDFKKQSEKASADLLASLPPDLPLSATSQEGFILHTADLPFYPGLSLCALTDPAAPIPNIYFLLQKQDTEGAIFPMDKTNVPIYAVNENLPITLTPETLVPYAKFFFFMVRGKLGRFIIVEKPEDVVWLTDAGKKEKEALTGHLMPVTDEGIDAEGLYSLKATVIFKDALFRTDIKAAPGTMDVFDPDTNATEEYVTGQMKLTNEEVLMEGLKVLVD